MKLSPYSQARLAESANYWQVDRDFADPMINYLVYGYEPGSCFTAVLANDWLGAMSRSHPANTVEAFKSLANWIVNKFPKKAYGSYDTVQAWVRLDAGQRRAILEQQGLIYTAREETWLALKGEEELV